MSFKEDVKKIELPKELHKRSTQGIKKSAQKKKTFHLKPAILTILITAAMLLFVFSQLNANQSTDVTSAALKDNSMPPIAISIAYIVTVVAILGMVLLWCKKSISRLLLILSFLAIMSTTWITSLKYTYELLDTEIYPLSVEIISDYTIHILSLDYMQPKSNGAPIRSLYLNDKSYSIPHYNNETGLQPFPFRLFNEFTNVEVQIPIEDIPDLINDEPIQARVIFADDTEKDVDVELFTLINHSETYVSSLYPTYKATEQSYIRTSEFQLTKDTFIDKIQFPKRIVGFGNYTLAINNEVVQDGPISAERFELSQTISKHDVVTLTHEIPKRLNTPLDERIYFIESNQNINIGQIVHKEITKSSIQSIVRKQRGEQREN